MPYTTFRSRVSAFITSAAMLLASTAAQAQSVTLAWNPNTEPDVAGYRVHYGSQPGVYTHAVDVGNQTTYEVTALDMALDYHFAVQAYSSGGLFSPLSSEVKLPAAVPPGTTTISNVKASVSFPLLVGTSITWTATAASRRGPVEYRFILHSDRTGWRVLREYGPDNQIEWTPAWEDLGTHSLQVWARTVGSPAAYEAWVSSDAFGVNTAPVTLTPDVDFPSPPGQPVVWTAAVAGARTALEYKFVLLNHTTGAWSILREYGSSPSAVWTPSTVGGYSLQVWARRVGSTAAYDVWGPSGTATIARGPLTVTALDADTSLPALTGRPITWTARTRGGQSGPLEFQFYRYSSKTGSWQMVQDYSTSKSYTWTPAWGEEGTHAVQVWARNRGSAASYDAWLGTNFFRIKRAGIHLTATGAFPAPPGSPVTWSAEVPDTTALLEYQYFVYDRGTGTWTNARPYDGNKTFTWTPAHAGTYALQVWVRAAGATAPYDIWEGTDYLTIKSGPAIVDSLTTDVPLPSSVGTPITWKAKASGGTRTPLEYRFVIYSEGRGWRELRGYGVSDTVTWTPSPDDVGSHAIQVWVRSAGATEAYEGWKGSPFFLVRP